MPLVPNQRLFEYRILRILGRGDFGTVYLAGDTRLNRPVAIQELTVTAQTDQVGFKRFLLTARAAGGLNHPHLVAVHALRSQPPDFYLVMEYVAGGSLRRLLQRGPLPSDEAVRIAAQLCQGLAAAHAKGIVHQDIRPENILLTSRGQVKVAGFGVAHLPRGVRGMASAQASLQPRTLIHMTPEQVRGQRVDGRSDVYQVGALLYQMVTGRHYVDWNVLRQRARKTAGSDVKLYRTRLLGLLAEAICIRDPRSVCQVRPEVPGWVGSLVSEALAKPVEKRPTADDLARALLGGRAVGIGGRAHPGAVGRRPGEEHLVRGAACGKQGRWNEAIREFQAVLDINPGCAEAHVGLGQAYEEQDRWDEAMREYQAAIQVGRDDARPHTHLAWCYWQRGRVAEAIGEYQAALRIDPDHAPAHFGLGLAYGDQGHRDEAIRAAERAVHLGFEPAQGLLAELGQVRDWTEYFRPPTPE